MGGAADRVGDGHHQPVGHRRGLRRLPQRLGERLGLRRISGRHRQGLPRSGGVRGQQVRAGAPGRSGGLCPGRGRAGTPHTGPTVGRPRPAVRVTRPARAFGPVPGGRVPVRPAASRSRTTACDAAFACARCSCARCQAAALSTACTSTIRNVSTTAAPPPRAARGTRSNARADDRPPARTPRLAS